MTFCNILKIRYRIVKISFLVTSYNEQKVRTNNLILDPEALASSSGSIGDTVTYFDIRRNGNVFFLAASVKIPEIFGVIRLVNLVDLEMITTERNKKYTYHWQVNWQ